MTDVALATLVQAYPPDVPVPEITVSSVDLPGDGRRLEEPSW